MSGLYIESEQSNDETSHAVLYMRRDVATQGRENARDIVHKAKENAREVRGNVDVVRGGKG
jgi:hypothetical protein